MENSSIYKNITATERDYLINRLNDEQLRLMIPAIVYIVILMVFGFIGNSMVLFYYRFKSRVTTYSIFISLLAVYDLLVCVLAMPMEITRLVVFYTFKSVIICKLLRFSNYFASIGSILALIVIASDRYRRICKWSAVQMSTRLANISCVLTSIIAVLLAWPALVLYGSQKISIPNDYGIELKGSMCTGTWDESYKPYTSAFYIFMFALLIVCAVILSVLYCTIGLKVFFHKRRLHRHKRNACPFTKQTTFASTDKSLGVTAATLRVNEPMFEAEDNSRLTLMLIIITVLFLISYVPLFAMILWRQSVGKHQIQFLSGASLVAYDIATTSFLISSAVNPWVYGIMCSHFRRYFIERFWDLVKKK